MKRIFTYEKISISLSFAMITVFAVLLLNQYVVNSKNTREHNLFYGANAKMVSLELKDESYSFSPENLADEYVIYNVLGSTSYKNYEIDSLRVFYGEGDYPQPNVLSGTFPTKEQLLSEKPICVAGQISIERNAVEVDGVLYYNHNGIDYEIVAVIGLDISSDLDVMVMLGWGGYFASGNTFHANFMIDGDSSTQIETALNNLTKHFDTQIESGAEIVYKNIIYESLIRVIDPITKNIYNIATVILLLNSAITAFSYAKKRQYAIAVKKLIGYTRFIIVIEMVLRFVAIAFAGYVIGILGLVIANNTESFKYSELSYFSGITFASVALSLLAIVALAVIVSSIPVIKIFKVDTAAVLK